MKVLIVEYLEPVTLTEVGDSNVFIEVDRALNSFIIRKNKYQDVNIKKQHWHDIFLLPELIRRLYI